MTRFSGRGRSSVESQKSTACRAIISSDHCGASAVSIGFSPRNIGACDLPIIWMLPIGILEARPCRSRNRSGRASSGRSSDSAPSRARAPPGCCGTCSCGRPGPSRWPARADACRWPTSTAASPSWRRRRRRRRCPPRRFPAGRRASTTTCVTAVPAGLVSSFMHHRVGDERDVGILERRPHAEHFGVALGVDQAGKAVAIDAADAAAERHVALR